MLRHRCKGNKKEVSREKRRRITIEISSSPGTTRNREGVDLAKRMSGRVMRGKRTEGEGGNKSEYNTGVHNRSRVGRLDGEFKSNGGLRKGLRNRKHIPDKHMGRVDSGERESLGQRETQTLAARGGPKDSRGCTFSKVHGDS